jgi:hypothetical protein
MKITAEWIKKNSTSPLTESFTEHQVRLLGETKTNGWIGRSIGKEIPDCVALQFEAIGLKGRSRAKYHPKQALVDSSPISGPVIDDDCFDGVPWDT